MDPRGTGERNVEAIDKSVWDGKAGAKESSSVSIPVRGDPCEVDSRDIRQAWTYYSHEVHKLNPIYMYLPYIPSL